MWFTNYVLQQSMTIGTSMISVLINIVTIQILQFTTPMEKSQTINDEIGIIYENHHYAMD